MAVSGTGAQNQNRGRDIMMKLDEFLPDIVPMRTEDFEKLAWNGALKHIGPVAAATPLQHALTGKTNCALYLLYMGCVGLCMKRTSLVIEQRWNPMLIELIFAYQFDWRYPKMFGITIDDVENRKDKAMAIRRSILYFFFEVAKGAQTFFVPIRPVSEVSFIINLTRHLCGKENAGTVDSWVEAIIERMAIIAAFPGMHNPMIYDYPDRDSWEKATLETHGVPLPPEVLDISRNLGAADLQDMANRWLETLSPEENPMLQPAQVLLANGFSGTPYRQRP